MKTVSNELKAHYASGSHTVAHLVKITRKDDEYVAITDHDVDIVFDSVTYQCSLSITGSAVETSSALNVDTMDAKGALLAIGVNESDIDAGLWDMADVRVMRVNWADLTMGCEYLKRGNIGEISIGRASFNSEFRGITQRLQHTVGDQVSPSCRNDLGDTRCGVTLTEGTYKFSAKPVTTTISARKFSMSSLTQTAGFFDAGKVLWTTGLNAGLSMEIKFHTSGGTLELQEQMPYAIALTDQATVTAGCLKRFAEDCGTKFDNRLRFRGFPFLPGNDQIFKGV